MLENSGRATDLPEIHLETAFTNTNVLPEENKEVNVPKEAIGENPEANRDIVGTEANREANVNLEANRETSEELLQASNETNMPHIKANVPSKENIKAKISHNLYPAEKSPNVAQTSFDQTQTKVTSFDQNNNPKPKEAMNDSCATKIESSCHVGNLASKKGLVNIMTSFDNTADKMSKVRSETASDGGQTPTHSAERTAST